MSRITDFGDRLIGEYGQGGEGPLAIFLAGIHGNEPAGITALARVFQQLEKNRPDFSGKLIGLVGNLAAVKLKQRYVDTDLNRLWSQQVFNKVQTRSGDQLNTEEKELKALMKILTHYLQRHPKAYMFDLHTTSAKGGLFSIVSSQAANKNLAAALHAPVVLGLVHHLADTTNVFMDQMGIAGLAFESGQHDDPRSVDLHESAIWILLERLGCIAYHQHPRLRTHHETLISASRHLPHVVEVTYRHIIEPSEKFQLFAGYENFQDVYEGEPVGENVHGAILCPVAGKMLMPLYQPQGNEGFFVVEAKP